MELFSQRMFGLCLMAGGLLGLGYLVAASVSKVNLGSKLWQLCTPLLDKAKSSSAQQEQLLTADKHFKSKEQNTAGEKPDQKPSERTPGTWEPVNFQRPPAHPYPDWNVHTTKPLPYRPFSHGPKYNVTMGLRNMPWDEWIELDNHYLKLHAIKARRIEERGHKCSRTETSDPRVFDGAVELLEELSAYLPERYPSMFQKTAVGIDNIITHESFDIRKDHLTMNGHREDPIQLCGRLIEDDLAIMFEQADGQYHLLSASILLAGFWRLEDKFGMSFAELHTSGEVPQFRAKLHRGTANFFRRVPPDTPVTRHNYFIQVDDDIAWSHSIGPEDADTVGWFTAQKNKAIEHHHFRSERQSLRRLPRSGGVVMTIRPYFHPITEIADEPYVPGRLASAVRSWGDDVSKYKGRERFGDVLLEYLDRKHAEQVANGLRPEREDEEVSFPW